MNDSRSLTILGSTGSVGANTLDVVRRNPGFSVFALSAHSNLELLLEQCLEFRPSYAVVSDASRASEMAGMLKAAECSTELLAGAEALVEIASAEAVDIVMAAIVGGAGLSASLAAAEAGKRVLLANKEALVMSGELFMDAVRRSGAELVPIDSEHNAIFQCLPPTRGGLEVQQMQEVDTVILTSSGGPFLDTPLAQLDSVTPEQACKHPKWAMGRKISVDSATMMNKGLEFIEACTLFGLPADRVEVLIHPQSIVHSMVRYRDGSVLAQMANPDMRIPIAHGLSYPQRQESGATALNLAEVGRLDFRAPDLERFPCLKIGMEAARAGGTAPVKLNAANEIAVAAFLDGRLPFSRIPVIISRLMAKMPCEPASSLAIIRDCDLRARSLANELIIKEFH